MALPPVDERCILLGRSVCKQIESRHTVSNYIFIVFSQIGRKGLSHGSSTQFDYVDTEMAFHYSHY